MSDSAISLTFPKGQRKRRRNTATRLTTQLAVAIAIAARATTTSLAFPVAYLESRQVISRSSFPFSVSPPSTTSQRIVPGNSVSSSTISKHGRMRTLEMVASPISLEPVQESVTFTAAETDDITMEDVVASASMEIQREQERRNQKLGESSQTPFDCFEAFDKARIRESEQVGLDRLTHDEGAASHASIDPSEIVSWNDLKDLMGQGIHAAAAASSSPIHHSIEHRIRDLYQRFQTSGGFLVVQLDEKDASTVDDMWSTMEAYFSLPLEKQQVDKQILEKDDGSHDPQSGYHFRQTYMNMDGEILPETIQNALREHGNNNNSNNSNNESYSYNRGVEGSYKLFADICKTVGTIVAAGALQKDLPLMDKVVTSLLDDKNGHPFVNADHRLSRYILGTNKSQKSAKEALISHTDWTFTTCIPLSAIPGLQVWKPHQQEWIVPEAILGGGPDRTRYVVVMAGKWIELLTHQKIASCVHRVVTQENSLPQARLSAPFFCRTKRSIFDTIQDECHESWSIPSTLFSQDEGIACMGDLFADLIRFLEGDRDPNIPDCVLELCLDGIDKGPGCFSIDEILGESKEEMDYGE